MSLREILGTLQPQRTVSNPTGDIQNIVNTGVNATDPNALMQQYAANPKMDFVKAVQYVKEHGGDPKTVCYELLKQKGIDPTVVAKMIGK